MIKNRRFREDEESELWEDFEDDFEYFVEEYADDYFEGDDRQIFPMEDFGVLDEMSALEIAKYIYDNRQNFNPNDDYFYYEGYGSTLCSTNDKVEYYSDLIDSDIQTKRNFFDFLRDNDKL